MSFLPSVAGRSTELGTVRDVLAGTSSRRAVLVFGEAGIGKSFLIEATTADLPEVTVLTGRCLPLASRLPLLPVAEALRASAAADTDTGLHAALARCPPHVAAEIDRIVPGTAVTAGHPVPPPSATPPDSGEGWRRHRLFDAVRQVFDALEATARYALVVEDLQWADTDTLDLLEYLLACGTRIPLVATCRDDAPASDHLAEWLERIPRRPGVAEVALQRMSPQETARQVELVLGHAEPVTADEVHRRSGGNPFFTSQLVDGLTTPTDSDDAAQTALPPGLARMLGHRLGQLGPDARQVVTTLASVRRPLDAATLLRATDRPADTLPATLAELHTRGLLATSGPGSAYQDSIALRHELIAEVVRAGLGDAERRQQHVALARALAASGRLDLSGEVADHLAACASADELPYRLAAALLADAVPAPALAADHWGRALELVAAVDDDDVVTVVDGRRLSVLEVYERAHVAASNAGDDERAARTAEQARARFLGRRGLDVDVALHTAVGRYRRWLAEAAAIDALDTAIAIGAARPVTAAWIRALTERAHLRLFNGDFYASAADLQAALAGAKRLGDAAALPLLLVETAWLAAADGDLHRADALAAQASEVGHPDAALEPYRALQQATLETDLLLDVGRLHDVETVGDAALSRAASDGLDRHQLTAIVQANLCEAFVEQGRTAEAARAVGLDDPHPSVSEFLAPYRSDVAVRLGRRPTSPSGRGPVLGRTTSIRREFALRRLERAIWEDDVPAALIPALDVVGDVITTDQSQFIAPLLVLTLRASADLAVAGRRTDDLDALRGATVLVSRILDLRDRARRDPFASRPSPTAAVGHAPTWTAELFRARDQDASRQWQRAANAWTDLQRPHRAAYAHWREAEELLARRGPRAEAVAALRAAATAARGHVPLSKRVASLATLARVDLTPTDRQAESPATNQPPAPIGAKLTPRELAVLRLLAAGQTNAQIGRALFISSRTAGVHVTNIMRKLDARSRVEAAVIGQQRDLL